MCGMTEAHHLSTKCWKVICITTIAIRLANVTKIRTAYSPRLSDVWKWHIISPKLMTKQTKSWMYDLRQTALQRFRETIYCMAGAQRVCHPYIYIADSAIADISTLFHARCGQSLWSLPTTLHLHKIVYTFVSAAHGHVWVTHSHFLNEHAQLLVIQLVWKLRIMLL